MNKSMNRKLIVSATPHIRSKEKVSDIMFDVLLALAPAAVMGTYYFGLKIVFLLAVSIVSCLGFEALFQLITRRKVTISDLSAVVTGVLLTFNLPASAPLWLPIVGSFFAIVIVKQLFGGLGQNFMNPALGARAFLLAAYPVYMTNWSVKPLGVDTITAATSVAGVSSATPLALLKGGYVPGWEDILNAFTGNISGCIGETCAAALLLGFAYLLIRKVISWRIPVMYIGTFALLAWMFGRNGAFTGNALFEVLTGGLLLGAIFMATDYSSSPITPVGQIIMGVGCGVLTAVIRIFGSYPEGVSYSILLMNLVVPLIDRATKPRIYGEVGKVARNS